MNPWQRHAHELANQHGILLLDLPQIGMKQSCVDVRIRVVYTSHIIDEYTYAAALHELGHLMAPGGFQIERLTNPNPDEVHSLTLKEERAAWDWARAVALTWTPKMEEIYQWAYNSYLGQVKDHEADLS